MGATKPKWRGNQLAFYDGITYETVDPIGAPILFYDDFLGTVVNTDLWTEVDVASATKAIGASILTYHLHPEVIDEAEDAGIYAKDDKVWDLDKGPIFECRLAIHVAPTLTSELIMGVQNDNYGVASQRVLAADQVDIHSFFGFYTTVGTGLTAVISTDDSANDSGVITTGITVVLDAYHIYRIDFTNVADVKFYIDGVGVATGTTFNMSTGTNVKVQPIVMLTKAVDDGLGDIYLDYVRIWQATR
jgi:hypothetical protein